MKLTLLGTGCPQCSARRFGPANLIRHGACHYLVDCGSGVTQRLVAAGSGGAATDAVFLTHLHSDHVIDLYQLVISSWHQGRDRPQRIFGPPGTRALVDGLMAVWEDERAARIAFERRTSTAAFTIEVTEIGPGEVLSECGLTVTAVAVHHPPIEHAFGFVFAADGRKLVFSGDTSFWPPLIAAARGADALVHEVFVHAAMTGAGGTRTEEGLANVASYHTLSSEVGEVARQIDPGVLFLNHFVPPEFDALALLDEVGTSFDGTVVVGEDLMSYDLVGRQLSHGDFTMRPGGMRAR